MSIEDKLKRLRALMQEKGLSAYYIPTDDFHLSEYVDAHFKARAYMTGFTGSAGTVVVTPDEACLWVDGRYFIQSEQQLSGTPVTLMKMGEEGVPTIAEYLSKKLPDGCSMGFDGRCVSADWALSTERMLATKKITLEHDMDLVGEIWEDRPSLPHGKVWRLSDEYAGRSAKDKLEWLRGIMEKNSADAHVLTSLDDIAWLLNIRGNDVPCNPVVLSYFICERERAYLFADGDKFSDEMREYLSELGVVLMPYDDVYEYARNYDEGDALMLSTKRVNFTLYTALANKAIIIDCDNPEVLEKSIKNPVEVENSRRSHIKDGLAVTRFMKWVKENAGKIEMSEISASDRLEAFRAEGEGFLGLSFDTICAYGPHAALPHYFASPETNAKVEPHGFLLVDSGGQYYEGTTDITRTFSVGELTETERHHFTLVLRSNLALGRARFLYGCRGNNLDVLAREPLWAEGLDYKHGTGHGVGYLLNVHEGPNHFMWKVGTGRGLPAVFEEGMITSNEPGIYIEGSHGIRTENLVVCRKGEKNEFGQFMWFETLTCAPIDLDCVDVDMLSPEDKKELNEYHAFVFDKLAPLMDKDEREWLRHYTRAV